LAAADIYCQPNIEPETFGIAFVEALYAGLPVVTTAIGGGLEIVDESCGRLVAPNDANALSQVLRLLITNSGERADLAAKGSARAYQLCDPARQLTQLHALLSRLVKQEAVA
jgi:glycosyltransferase involved in cell wall biosynthesis